MEKIKSYTNEVTSRKKFSSFDAFYLESLRTGSIDLRPATCP